ncbi:MAG TPA: tRNA (adenosine(37)-N6)-dimethylallyltransferase MiaA [Erysipelothrix sp.]|nr:tRNA (adenosine(37)-N6)-dimethylallyltransferase MiaA [Erysipelothrix sp.]
MKKVIVIAGLTATGKTSTAVKLAKAIDAEIISADSVAVYKGLDIGSAKPSLEEQDGIKHHFIDIQNYKDTYNVALFQEAARKLIKEIHAKDKHVIIAGGTGLYIKALLYDYRFEDESKEAYSREESTEVLYKELQNKDKETAKTIHPNNRKRILRALESFELHQKPRSEITHNNKDTQIIDADVFFLQGDRQKIYERINKRVHTMFELGLEKEVKDFYEKDPDIFKYPSFQSIGYREFEDYLNNNIDKDTLIRLIQRNTRRFAKRQITWFKHQQPSVWIDIFNEDPIQVILENIK